MPFYLYGSVQDSDSEYHIDHTLAAAPNTQLTAGEVTISTNGGSVLPSFTEASPYIKIIVDFPERAMQPFPPNKDIVNDPNFFFRPRKVLPFTVEGSDVKGSLTLTNNVFADTDMLNEDPVPEKHVPERRVPEKRVPEVPVPKKREGEEDEGEGDAEEGDAEGGDAEEGDAEEEPEEGECYAREYSLRAHAYAVALLGAGVHTITHLDTVAPGRGWQDIIVCTLVAYVGMKSHTSVPRIPFRVLMISKMHRTRRVVLI
jgi:hypothetical protein